MADTVKSTTKTPDPDPIIELVETVNVAYVVLAFIAGALIVAGIVYYIGTQHVETQGETE